MILLLDVQRKSIVVAGGMKEAIGMASFGAPMATLLICPTRRKETARIGKSFLRLMLKCEE